MTVGEFRKALETAPDDMLVGAEDRDGEVCKIQFAGMTNDYETSPMYFLIHANGGFLLFDAD